ncbi:MAG: 5'-3' exonuclease H3TH domain-containing protein [Patescibacteria group bacterium]|nr:5'-3' exonuclease H3TH domain-containing protein [Patescibacteria group bacterium]
MKKRLVLIDGHAIVYRAYYAFPATLKTKSGEQANAVYGFLSILLSVIRELKPSHIAVSFDMDKPTFRHLEFADYKAQRPKTDKELTDQLDLVHESVRRLNIPIFEVEGFEADDVIGTLAKQSYQQKIKAVIVTGDQDAMQLVNDNVKVYTPARGRFSAKMYGEEEVLDRYGFEPIQMIDYKALCGDPSDNIPGIKGVGPKTAKGLIDKYVNIEGIYKAIKDKSIEGIGKAMLEKLTLGYEDAIKSKMLATIVLDVPITLKLKKCALHEYDKSKAISFLEELGFYSIIKRLPSDYWSEKAEEIFTKERKLQTKNQKVPNLEKKGRQASLF